MMDCCRLGIAFFMFYQVLDEKFVKMIQMLCHYEYISYISKLLPPGFEGLGKMTQSHDFVRASRKQWSSESAFIASMAAAAAGLGNLWRFPYIMGQNGGGTFLIAYFIALIVVVLPIMMLDRLIYRLISV